MTLPDEDPRQRLTRAVRRHQGIKKIREELEAAIVYALTEGVSPTEVGKIASATVTDRYVRQIAQRHGLTHADKDTSPESSDGP